MSSNLSAQLILQDHSEGDDIDAAIGLEEQATDILKYLIGGTKHLQVISICGMPGVGKTTLANKLYNHPAVNYRFDKHSWCVISHAYQRQSVLTDIFIQLTGESSTLQIDEASLVERVYKTLKGRRYLIVLDDIWDSRVWDGLRSCFPDDCTESRILLTTRDKDVAPLNSRNFTLRPLSNDQCWELLAKKVFRNNPCSPELLGIGKEISANCHGLPLIVVVIAGILSTLDKKKSTWEEVVGNLASYILSVMDILELSYKHLPNHLKTCFLYFGAFQKGSEIRVSELMRLWVSEGFIHEEEGKSAENVAKEYLIKLIDKSLVIVAKTRSVGGVKACAVHDLLHDLCLKKCEEENFPNLVKTDDCGLKYLDRCDVPLVYCQHFRSFHKDHIGSEYDLLRLRYLVVSVLPPSIGSLVNLEYLRVESLQNNVILPPEIMKMMKLRDIHVEPFAVYGRDWDVSHTNNLEFLSAVVIANLKDEEMLKCSPHLRKLKCKYEEESVSMMKSTRRAPPRRVDISFLTQLVSLNVYFEGFVMLERISFPSSIKKLTLSGNFIRLWDEMSKIGRLENLEVLKIRQVWSSVGFRERWDTRDGEFQKLIFLEINDACLCQWKVASNHHFPRLQRLMLRDCSDMEEIPSEIGEITTLQLIEVRGKSPNSLVESTRRIQQEQGDMGNDDLRIVVFKI